jgi:branched-chain amino acid transport system substrate-binding protein
MKTTILIAAMAATMTAAVPIAAQDLHFPSLSYRTGAFAAGGIPFADGYADYLTLINERDGGIGGVPIRQSECETAYDTERGVECYQSIRDDKPLILQPLSTGITYQLIPRATEDGVPIHSMGYGRTSAADGRVFEWVFNYPGTYWDAASIMVLHALDVEGGSLEGKKITLLYHNSAYGREPIRTLELLAERYGFDFTTIAVDSPGQEQGNQWLQIRRERPDFVFFWGWGVMNQVAVQEAANIRFPMDRFFGVWWSGSEPDVLPAGAGAHGYKSVNFTGTGTDYPIFDDIRTHVLEPGLQAGDGRSLGTVQYNRGLYAAMLAVEAARTAQEIHGVAEIDAAMMRDGMEALNVTEERMAELGLPGFAPPVTVTCENHSGPGMALVQQWDAEAQTWNAVTDYINAEREVINSLIEEDSLGYAAENNIDLRCN